MNRLGLRGRLILITLAPLLGLLFFSVKQVRQDWGELQQARTIGLLDELVVDLSAFMEAINIERAAAFNFGGPNFATYADDWKNQPAKTDATVSTVRQALAKLDMDHVSMDLKAEVANLNREMDQLGTKRQEVERGAIKPLEALGYYRKMAAISMNIVTEAARMPDSAELSNYFASIVFLMRSTDAVAQARLHLRVAFDNGSFKGAERSYLDAAQMAARDKSQFENMMSYATKQQRQWADEMRAGPSIQEAEKIENYGLSNMFADKFEYKGMDFRTKQNEKMLAYSKLRNRYLDDMLRVVNDHASAAKVRIGVSVAIAALAILLALGLAGFVSWDLLRTTDNVVADLNAASRQTLSASQQVSASSQSLAAGASQQASSMQETTATLDQIAVAVARNADDAAKAETLAKEAHSHSKSGAEAMTRMIDAIQSIKQASDQTARINKTIDEIAFQTNLLALNAAVEAARAGDAGRGFAVVAEEVRNLATRSAEAARVTSQLIEDSRHRADQGVTMSTEVNASLSAIQSTFDKMNALVRNVAGASREQQQMVSHITQAIAEMDNIIQTNAAGAEETAAASEELSAQAHSLSSVVTDLTHIMRGTTAQTGTAPMALPATTIGTGSNGGGNGHAAGNGGSNGATGSNGAAISHSGSSKAAAAGNGHKPTAAPGKLRSMIEMELTPRPSGDIYKQAEKMTFRDLPDNKG